MSGRGAGGRGGRGAWRGRGRGAPGGPVAKDDDGNAVLDTQPAGPPPLFPEMSLPHHPTIDPRDQVLLLKRHDLAAANKKSPFFIEAKDSKTEDVDTLMDSFLHQPPPSSTSAATTAAEGQQGPGTAAATVSLSRKRTRAPLTSVIKLLPEYFPDELYSSSDRRYAKLQDTYFKRLKRSDVGLHRLDDLMRQEGAAGEGVAGDGAGEGEVEEEVIDEDDEEDMDQDDYYQGAEFDDDEEYDAGFDNGGDNDPVF